MLAFIIRRLFLLPLVFFGVTLFIVLLMQVLSPYQRAAAYAQTENQARNLDAIIERYGLTDPWYMQYGRWLGQVAQGNLRLFADQQRARLDHHPQPFCADARAFRTRLFAHYRGGHLAGYGGGSKP